jgi:hypothetical protein
MTNELLGGQPHIGTLIDRAAGALMAQLAPEAPKPVDTEDVAARLVVNPVQEAVAAKYRETVLVPRHAIWDGTQQILSGETPQEIYLWPHRNGITTIGSIWELGWTDARQALTFEARLSCSTDLSQFGSDQQEEINRAIHHLSGYKQPVPQEGFLGVPAEKAGLRRREVPRVPLARAVGGLIAARTDSLSVEVALSPVAASLQDPTSPITQRKTAFTVSRAEFTDLPADFSPEHAARILAATPNPHGLPIYDAIERHMTDFWCRGVGEQFATLEAINQQLESQPPGTVDAPYYHVYSKD